MKTKVCKTKGCNNEFTAFNTIDSLCYDCRIKKDMKKPKKNYKPIKKVSKKRMTLNKQYSEKRREFLENLKDKRCPVFPNLQVTDIHHQKKRIGYADEWARLNNVSLLLDDRFWLAVSRQGHQKIEENPIWAKKNGFSLDSL